MKKGVIGSIILVIFLVNFISAAQTATIKADGKDYNITLLTTSGSSSVTIDINSVSKTMNKQWYIFSPGVECLPTYIKTPGIVGESRESSLFVFIKKNLTDNNPSTNFSFNGKDYSVNLINIGTSNSAKFTVNDESATLYAQPSPPYTIPYIFGQSPELKVIVTNLVKPVFAGDNSSATLLLGFEVNLSIECPENWTCTDWSNCSDGLQVRTCNDTTRCGNEKNRPSLSQICSSPNPNPKPNPSCTSECTNTGIKICSDESHYKICSDYNEDDCLEWGEPLLCPLATGARVCSGNGECKNSVNVTNPECQPVGLRQSGKYCSSDNKWIVQKLDGKSCENNFECKINNCLSGKCGSANLNPSPEPNFIIVYWIVGIVCVLVVIIIIYLIIKKRS